MPGWLVALYTLGWAESRLLVFRLPDPTWRPLIVHNVSNPAAMAVDEQNRRPVAGHFALQSCGDLRFHSAGYLWQTPQPAKCSGIS